MPIELSSYQQGILAIMGINVLLAYSVFMPLKTGQISLGNAGFMAIGAYGAALLTLQLKLPLLVAVILAGILAALIGVGVGFPALRLQGIYLAMATLGFGEIVRTFFLNFGPTGSAAGIRGMFGTTWELIWAWVLVATAFFYLLGRSRLGHSYDAVHDDETVAALMGLNVTWLKVSAFGIGAFFAGVAGGLFAHHNVFIEPSMFGFAHSLEMALYLLLGGMNTFVGPILGAALFVLLPEWLRFLKDWRGVFFGAVLIGLLIVRPSGLLTRDLLSSVSAVFPRREPERTIGTPRAGKVG